MDIRDDNFSYKKSESSIVSDNFEDISASKEYFNQSEENFLNMSARSLKYFTPSAG